MRLISNTTTQVEGSFFKRETVVHLDEKTNHYYVSQSIIDVRNDSLFSNSLIVLTSPLSQLFPDVNV